MKNPFPPYPVGIKKVEIGTEDKSLRNFELEFINAEDAEKFKYLPGHFAELSFAGYGESPIGIASSPTEGKNILFTVNKAGVVTTKLHNMVEGDVMGIRGPLGHPCPLKEMEGKNIVILAGGYAVTTLRSTMVWLLNPENRSKYEDITFVYGARTPGMLLYKVTFIFTSPLIMKCLVGTNMLALFLKLLRKFLLNQTMLWLWSVVHQ